MEFVNLHIHTSASDGFFSPSEVVSMAYEVGLKAVAITDHDTVAGVGEALDKGKELGLEVISGVEISVDDERLGLRNIHVVGLFINHKNKELNKLLKKSASERVKQRKRIVSNLRKEGFDITFEEVLAMAQGVVGRPHIAKVLLHKYPDKFSKIQDVFDEYLHHESKVYAERDFKVDLKTAIDTIHKAGGLAFLAHPKFYSPNDVKIIRIFKNLNGDGIETVYTYNNSKKLNLKKNEINRTIKSYKNIVKKLKLLESGGTDFHTEKDVFVSEAPYFFVEKMKFLLKK